MAKQRRLERSAIETFIAHEQVQVEKSALGDYVRVDTIGHGPAINTDKEVALNYTCSVLHYDR